MASETKWRKPRWAWTGYFNKWLSTSDPEVLLKAKIVFDFRPVHGDKAIAEGLREHAIIEASRNTAFTGRLARDCTTMPPPLSLFRSFVVEKDGEHKNRLDLKMRGLVPIVDFARMMALKHCIRETNTLARLRLLGEAGEIPGPLVAEIVYAYEFLMHLRLVHQLKLIEDGLEPHNHLDPGDLTYLERRILQEAFSVVGRIQTFVSKIRTESV